MGFAAPYAFLLFPVVLGVVLLFLLTFRWKDRALLLFASGSSLALLAASASRPRQVAKVILVVLALAAAVFALARPYLGEGAAPRVTGQADLLVVLDVSLSMAAQDLQPSRLAHAKQQLFGLLDNLQGDRIGLVVFGGNAALRFPLTYDYEAARVLTRAEEIDSAPSPGTAVAEGVRTAVRGLRQSKAPLRAIFLLSDGEDHGSPLAEAVQEAAAESILVYGVGIGTVQGGTIPVPSASGAGPTLKRDRAGQIVRTQLQEAPLRFLAETTGGSYQRATGEGRELLRAYERFTRKGDRTLAESREVESKDLTPYFALLAFLFLLIELLVPERRSRRAIPSTVLAALLPLLLLTTAACTQEDDVAFQLNQLGNELYHEAQFPEALEAFRRAQVQRPDLPQLNFNVGTALYKTEEFERALRETQRTLTAEETELRAKAHGNMGNAYFKLQLFRDAFEEYKKALREDPNDLDAKINLELALRKLQEQDQGQQGQQGTDPAQQTPSDTQQSEQDPGNGNNTRSGAQQRSQTEDPAAALRRALREAGEEVTIEEALRILDALRERERQLQSQYNKQPANRFQPQRPDKDW